MQLLGGGGCVDDVVPSRANSLPALSVNGLEMRLFFLLRCRRCIYNREAQAPAV